MPTKTPVKPTVKDEKSKAKPTKDETKPVKSSGKDKDKEKDKAKVKEKDRPAKAAREDSGSRAALRAVRAEREESGTRAAARAAREEASNRFALKAVSANLKSPFPAAELAKWRQRLFQRRTEISQDIGALEKDAMEAEDGHTTPNHIAERGSDADLQEVSLGCAADEKDLLWQIDRALRKIDDHRPIPFGLCEYSHEAIPLKRLEVLPWTPLSIEGATFMEDNRLTIEDLLIDD